MMQLAVKQWSSFQHYKDRSPLWIKLHRGLLDNREYYLLSPLAGKCLPLIWIIASEKGGLIPTPDELSFRLRIDPAQATDILGELLERDFIVEASEAEPAEQNLTPAQRRAAANGFGSRHISDLVKRTVWARDKGICKNCGSDENIEYDHIHPVSKGGNSNEENIQLLCRPCNRSKRVSVAPPAQPSSEPAQALRSLEKRREESREEKKTPPVAEATRGVNVKFEEFWKERPRRDGDDPRKPAEKKFNALVKTGVDPDVMISGAKLATVAAKERGIYGTKFVPQTVKWLNDQRFVDYAAAAFVEDKPATELYYAKDGSEQLDAWDAHTVQTTGKHLPRDKNQGWLVASEWPPGYEPMGLTRSHIELPRLKSMGDLH